MLLIQARIQLVKINPTVGGGLVLLLLCCSGVFVVRDGCRGTHMSTGLDTRQHKEKEKGKDRG
jgi:hypothetical protein